MNLVLLAALIAVCSAAKLDRSYLPPESAKTAGGSPGDIQTPLVRDLFNPGQSGLPKGAFDNDFDGVVVEAAAPGTRASSPGETGLGADRVSYGSTHSKVGGAAFKTNQQGFNIPNPQNNFQSTDQIESQTLQNFQQGVNFISSFNTARPQAEFDKASNIVRFENNVSPQAYNYAFETDNGITAEENGVAVNGIQAEGGYSYTGDDGKVYKVTYTAGEGGYQPSGDHLPTPPPIPEEILKSLEQNAKEAAGGIVDDGSYDAEKYNIEDDRTKSESDNAGQQYNGQFGVPESDAHVSGTFINQNTRVFDSLNTPQQPQTTNEDIRNNVFESVQNNLQPKPTFATALGKQPLSGAPFEQSKNGDASSNFGTSESNKKDSNQEDTFSDNDDYSRPIYFGTPQLNLGSNNKFGIKQSYLPPANNIHSNNRPSISINSYSSQNTGQSISESSTFGSQVSNSNVNKPLVTGQIRPQSIPSSQFDQFSQNFNSQSSNQFINGQFSDLNKNENTQSGIQASYNTFNNIPSTLQPSAELTTPFEDSPTSTNKFGNTNVPLTPTQASFSDVTDPISQSSTPQIGFGTSNQNLNQNEIQQTNILSQQPLEQLTNTNINLSGSSQFQGPDHSYYYNLPSKPFNVNRVTTPTFQTGNRPFNSGFNNGAATRYPRPPTIVPTIASSMYNQYSNTPQSSPSASFNDRYRPSTKYPQSTVVTQILPSPTSPTKIDGFPEQYTGITQASVSPFPSNSNKYTSPSENQKSENIGQDLPQNFQINSSFQKQTTSTQSFNRDQATLSGSQGVQQTPNQVQTELNTLQLSSSQQYNGEIYEYSKPAQSLSTTESNEDTSTLTDNFSQFGQKLRPSIQSQQKAQGIQTSSNRGQQNQLAGTRPQQPTNLQGQFDQNKHTQNRISTSDATQDFNRQQTIPSSNLQTTDVKPKLETTKFTSGASAENQPTEYKRPFDFSTRIRPCCQGPSTGQNVKDYRKRIQSQDKTSTFGISAQFGHQDNQKSGVSENSFNTPSTGFRPQTLQTTSQPGGVEEIFGGPRRPPSFDDASGYYY